MIAKAGKRSFSNYKSAALPAELCRQFAFLGIPFRGPPSAIVYAICMRNTKR